MTTGKGKSRITGNAWRLPKEQIIKSLSTWRFLAAASFLSATLLGSAAKAAVVINVFQSGSNVFATGSGSILLPSVTPADGGGNPGVFANIANLALGVSDWEDTYMGIATGPASFGSGGSFWASSGSGDFFGIQSSEYVIVPTGYVSGDSLNGSATWLNTTLSGLGLTDGTYVYTVTDTLDTITVNVGSAVPEPSTWALLLGAGAGLFVWRRRSSGRA